MYYERILAKTQRGEALTKRELNFLKLDIGEVTPIYKHFLIIFLMFLGFLLIIISFGFFLIEYRNIYLLIIGCVIFSYCLVKLLFKNYSVLVDDYLSAIHNYYEAFKKKHNDMRFTLTHHIPSEFEYLVKNQVLVFTDGYQFIVYDDFLLDTPFLINNIGNVKINKNISNPKVIKVFDENTIHKDPFIFKISEVIKYSFISKQKEVKNEEFIYDPYIITYIDFEYFDHVQIEFHDGRKALFGSNLYRLLREYIPKKENVSL